MNQIYTLIAIVFIGILLFNLFLRLYVLKLYRKLVAKEVDFGPEHFFNATKLKEEILPKYPDSASDIRRFINLVRLSTTIATVIIAVIIYLAYTILTRPS